MNITANTGKHFNSELLIAGLDGYDKAKEILDNCPQFYHEYQPLDHGHYKSGYYRDAAINRISMINLRKALLEYRRAHNIFEMDDYIIHDGELKVFAMWSTAIEGCAYIGYAYAEDGEMAKNDEFRHATDQEIESKLK